MIQGIIQIYYKSNTKLLEHSTAYKGMLIYNKLSHEIKSFKCLMKFKKYLLSWCVFVRASLHMHREENQLRCHWMLYCTYDMLNMFRALLCPSSGAWDYMCVITAYGVLYCKGEKIWLVLSSVMYVQSFVGVMVCVCPRTITWPKGHVGGRLLLRYYDLYQKLQLQFYVLLMMGAMDTRNM